MDCCSFDMMYHDQDLHHFVNFVICPIYIYTYECLCNFQICESNIYVYLDIWYKQQKTVSSMINVSHYMLAKLDS